jgi:fermentation-respiration switch protein FrsA (DUF1100 family)
MIYVLLIYLVWCGALFLLQNKMMFPAALAGSPGDGPWRADAVVLERALPSGETAVAWLFVPGEASAAAPVPLVAYFHGNAELIDTQQRVVEAYDELGLATLLVEYRGYGHSDGSPSQRKLTDDGLHFIQLALDTRDDLDPQRLVLHGRSIGGAVAAQVAAQREPQAIILESTITHTGAFAWRYGVPPLLVRNPFRTKDVLPKLDCPVLLFHGEDDGIITQNHSRKLHKLTPGSTLITYPDTGHNDFPGPGNETRFWRDVQRFLIEADILPPQAEP